MNLTRRVDYITDKTDNCQNKSFEGCRSSFMNTSVITLTLMRNSKKINVDISKIVSYKSITMGCGAMLSLTERLDGDKTIVVDESVSEIDKLIFKLARQKKAIIYTPSIDCLRFSGNHWISKVHLPSLKHAC